VGTARAWDLETGIAAAVGGEPPKNRISDLGISSDGLVACAQDNTVIYCTTSPPAFGDRVTLEFQPKAMGCGGTTVAVVGEGQIVIITNKAISCSSKLDYTPAAVAVAPNAATIAVGSEGEPAAVYVLDSNGAQKFKLDRHKNTVSAVAFSPDSAQLASGCANKEVVIWSTVDGSPLVTGLAGFHTARITTVAWSPSGALASGGVDSGLIFWDLENKKAKAKLQRCHASGGIEALTWVDDKTAITCGADGCIKSWTAP
jgi:WD40 repeat protein